jgi:hypothetical protein
MNRNKTGECNSKTGEILKVQGNNSSKTLVPYYWSWYGSIFPSRIQPENVMPTVTAKENYK